jgi:hypothetical protein
MSIWLLNDAGRLFLGILILGLVANSATAEEEKLPSFGDVAKVVETSLAHRGSGDIISRGDLGPVFRDLDILGWTVEDEKEILQQVLASGDPIVTTLRSNRGRKFIRQVAGYRLIYDRLDRIAQQPGGQRLIQDLIKLPDAARYAKMAPARGVPGMMEFLPKDRSGKTRKVKDYNKPTGKIYTANEFLKRLRKSYDEAVRQLVECPPQPPLD